MYSNDQISTRPTAFFLKAVRAACGAVTIARNMVGKEKKMVRRGLEKEGKAKLEEHLVHLSTFRTAATSQRSQTPASRAREFELLRRHLHT